MSGRTPVSDGPRRLLVLLVPLLLPWTLVASGGAVSLVFPWGMVGAWPLPVNLVSLPEYLLALSAGLPRYLRAWPWSVVLYACALAGATWNHRTGRSGGDLVAPLLALAGVSSLLVSVGIWRSGRLALPLGTVVLWTLAWAVHRSRAPAA